MNALINTKRVNVFFAYLAIAFGLFSIVFIIKDAVTLTNQYMDALRSGAITSTGTTLIVDPAVEAEIDKNLLNRWSISAIIAFIVSLASFVFQSICNFQWAGCLNRNISETNQTLTTILNKSSDEDTEYDFMWMIQRLDTMYIQQWPFFVYIITSVLGVFFNDISMLLSVMSFVFLSLYLAQIFKVCIELIDIKSQFYSFYLKSDYREGLEYTIHYRNIIMFFFFSILTLGIYWYYLLFKLTNEINLFLERDEKLREKLPQSPILNGDDHED